MSLWKLWKVEPCLTYRTSVNETIWHDGKIYQFFYYPNTDQLVLWIVMSRGSSPAKYKNRYQFNAESGTSYVGYDFGACWFFDLFVYAATTYESGSFKKVYGACYFLWGLGTGEVNWSTMGPLSGGWFGSFSGYDGWTSAMGFYQPRGLVVNREDQYMVLGWHTMPYIFVWKFDGTLVGAVPVPGNIADFAYEDRYRMWAITDAGFLIKLNYHTMKVEVLSQIDNPSPSDLGYRIAWDSKRGRVAVFRHRPDSPGGLCQSIIEFYRPIPKVEILTNPVPLKPLRVGQNIPMSFNLVGDAGEGIASYLVKGEMEPPVDGVLIGGLSTTGMGGVGKLGYLAPADPATEKLIISADIDDGEEVPNSWENFEESEYSPSFVMWSQP